MEAPAAMTNDIPSPAEIKRTVVYTRNAVAPLSADDAQMKTGCQNIRVPPDAGKTLADVLREIAAETAGRSLETASGGVAGETLASELENLLMKARQDTARFCCGV
jgi:hypothetical protein